jgi:hypothetical protein
MLLRTLFVLGLLLAPSLAMAQAKKSTTGGGSMQGVLLVQWSDENRFIYVPDGKDPLRFSGGDGREIRPGRMYTDGGSIPRVFWGVRGFSPWGYAPAYVLHDWLFHQHRCKRDLPPTQYSLAAANQVLEDVIDILFKTNKAQPNPRARALIKWAVDTYGKTAWDEACGAEPPPPSTNWFAAFSGPTTVERLSFSD